MGGTSRTMRSKLSLIVGCLMIAVTALAVMYGSGGGRDALAASDGSPEMGLSLASGGGCSLSTPTTCFVPAGQKFEVSIDAVEIPNDGYVAAAGWIYYGDALGDQGNDGFSKGFAVTWPDCNQGPLSGSVDTGGSPNIDSVFIGCLTGASAPPPTTYVGSLFTVSLTCTQNESSTLLELIPFGESPADDSGSNYADSTLTKVVPKVNDLTIVCTDETTDSDGDGCTDLVEVGANAALGGGRSPSNPWDFYDVSGIVTEAPDGFVDLLYDVLGVINHFAPTGMGPTYDVHYDRGPSSGPNAWNMTAPDGKIDLMIDILGVISQFGHDCR